MLLICPEKNTYTWPQAPAKIKPFPSCPRGDSGDKEKSRRAGKKKHVRLDFPLPPLSAPGYARMFWRAWLGAKLLMACEQPFCSGKGWRNREEREGKEWEPVDKHFFEVIYGGSNGCNCLRAKISENKGRINMNSCPVKVTLKVENLIFLIRASNNIYFSNLYFNIA